MSQRILLITVILTDMFFVVDMVMQSTIPKNTRNTRVHVKHR